MKYDLMVMMNRNPPSTTTIYKNSTMKTAVHFSIQVENIYDFYYYIGVKRNARVFF